MKPSITKVALVTGANSGVGYSLTKAIVSSFVQLNQPIKVIMACRNMKKAEEAKIKILETLKIEINDKFSSRDHQQPHVSDLQGQKNTQNLEDTIDICQIDLSSVKNVLDACNQIRLKYNRLDFMVLNAGVIPVKSLDLWNGSWDMLTKPAWVMTTGGNIIVQEKGKVTNEGIGAVFCANTFGHYVMVRELEDLLAVPGDARVMWVSSTTAESEFFDPEDIQGLKSKKPYESAKRLSDILCLAMAESLRCKHIYMFSTSPGVLVSNILQDAFPSFVLIIMMYLMRLLYISGINIHGDNAITSMMYLIHSPNPSRNKPSQIKYHSDVTPWGSLFVKELIIEDQENANYIWNQVEMLYTNLKKRISNLQG